MCLDMLSTQYYEEMMRGKVYKYNKGTFRLSCSTTVIIISDLISSWRTWKEIIKINYLHKRDLLSNECMWIRAEIFQRHTYRTLA